ncbi:MAG: hypothetical protein SVU32_03805 [Candidatus Nanohaloarchaea archaeon]|nr:hypothetical protein [Candidatus Nanohaloarchaea archaeon]
MRCAHCDERFDPREETIMHELDDVLRRFHPSCYIEFEQEHGGGEAQWSGGPPYDDIVLLGAEDFKNLVSDKTDTFNLERLLDLEEQHRDREEVKDWLQEQIEERHDLLNEVEQLE